MPVPHDFNVRGLPGECRRHLGWTHNRSVEGSIPSGPTILTWEDGSTRLPGCHLVAHGLPHGIGQRRVENAVAVANSARCAALAVTPASREQLSVEIVEMHCGEVGKAKVPDFPAAGASPRPAPVRRRCGGGAPRPARRLSSAGTRPTRGRTRSTAIERTCSACAGLWAP